MLSRTFWIESEATSTRRLVLQSFEVALTSTISFWAIKKTSYMSFLKYRRSVRWLEYVLLWCAYWLENAGSYYMPHKSWVLQRFAFSKLFLKGHYTIHFHFRRKILKFYHLQNLYEYVYLALRPYLQDHRGYIQHIFPMGNIYPHNFH